MAEKYLMKLHDVEEYDSESSAVSTDCFFQQEIGHGLGRIGVRRNGDLAYVELDERAIRTTTPERLGSCLVEAISRAGDKLRRALRDEAARAT